MGTEPFLYIADPEFLKKMSTEVLAKKWGKPRVFRHDRDPLFGNGLVMVEGNEWVRHRHVIAPAFSPLNLKVCIFLYISVASIYNTDLLENMFHPVSPSFNFPSLHFRPFWHARESGLHGIMKFEMSVYVFT